MANPIKPSTDTNWSPLRIIIFRYCFIFFALHNFPFPISDIPGDEFESDILFHDNRFFAKNFGKGSHFTFMEGRNKVGEGKVLEVIGLVSFHKE